MLLRAWPDVHRRTGARLRIVGADPLAVGRLLGRERGAEGSVDILGVLSRDELDRELAHAKLLVAPSLGAESFGMVLTRAFAAATPVIASDIDGYRQLVTDRCGVLVPPGDERRLTHAVVLLLEDELLRRRCASASRWLAVAAYAWPSIAGRMRALYEQILDEAPGESATARR